MSFRLERNFWNLKTNELIQFFGLFIILFFLIQLFVLPLHSTFLSLKYQKKFVKREIKKRIIEGIDASELVYFKFSKKDVKSKLRWEHAKEFEWKGEMYDVVHSNEEKDSIAYHCWWDSDESQLNRKLMALLQTEMEHYPGKKERLLGYSQFYKNLQCPPNHILYGVDLFQFLAAEEKEIFIAEFFLPASTFLKVNDPPPKV